MIRQIRILRVPSILVVSTCAVTIVRPAGAELTAAECVLIYNSRSPDSEGIARHYAIRRGVPQEQRLGIDLPLTEDIPREQYESLVRPAVREFLSSNDWGSRTRCLITCYDMPLRVQKLQPTKDQLRRADVLEDRLGEIFDALTELVDRISDTDLTPPNDPNHSQGDRPGKHIVERDRPALDGLYDRYLQEQARLASRHEGLTGAKLVEARKKSFQYIQLTEGSAGVLRRGPGDADGLSANAAVRVRVMKDKIAQAQKRMNDLLSYGSSFSQFEEGVSLAREVHGLFGVAAVTLKRVASLRSADSASSLDSELALVLHDSYEPDGWLVNDLHHARQSTDATEQGITSRQRTLMVCRLDGPTPGIVRRMIADAIEVERRGLEGTFYIDARGVKGDDASVRYDRDLIELARMVRTQTKMPVVLDVRPDVFQPGDCPNAALYCGWYSLADYVDAFDFVPGAVAVHIASFELVSLRGSGKEYWCKGVLGDGAAATFGATSEPYLQSFPLPTEFFGRLLTGKYTLAEVYSQTKPFNSWRISLLGDPLYSPFKTNPQLPADWDQADH